MKNREKYKNELVDVIKMDGRICGFMKNHDVYRMLGKDWESFCGMDCIACDVALNLWLDEEYEDPEIDWNNVPVDTLVRVREREDQEWILRYFKGINEDSLRHSLRHRYEAWESGATSKTAKGKYLCWNYCERVDDEDDGSN